MSVKSSSKEVVLIVVGVLLAFGIESVWSDFQEARQDRGYLRALRVEIVEDQTRITASLGLANDARRAADSLRRASLEEISVPTERIPGLLWRATSVAQLDVTSTALESLFRSPAWARLDDPALQVRLASLDEELDRFDRASQRATTYWFDSFEPRLRGLIDYDEWSRIGEPDRVAAGVPLSSDWGALLSNPEIMNLLTHTAWFAREAERMIDSMLAQIDEVAALLP